MGTINYAQSGEWSGYTLESRPDGLWRYEQWSQVQGHISGRVVLLQAPDWWAVEDAEDMESRAYNPAATKAEMLLHHGTEVRCLRRGYKIQ